MKYRDEKFYWTYQHGVGWPDDYIGPDSNGSLDNRKIPGFYRVWGCIEYQRVLGLTHV